MLKKKVLNVLINKSVGNQSYIDFLSSIFDLNVFNLEQIYNEAKPPKIDLVFFSGGEDVNPSLYNQNVNSKTSYSAKRDDHERNMFDYALNNKIPCLGICRGSQFLTVMNGGSLIQHVENHAGVLHNCETNDGRVIKVNSTHHQMCFPFNLTKEEYAILAWSQFHQSNVYEDGNDKEIELPTDFIEPEVILYEKNKCLAIQYHPEMNSCHQSGRDFAIEKISEFLNI